MAKKEIIICQCCGRHFAYNGSMVCLECAKFSPDEQRRMVNARIFHLHPCKYCGSLISEKKDYCNECRRDGFADVHELFGLTNGWDKPPKSKPFRIAKDDPRRKKIKLGYSNYNPANI